MGTGKSGGGKLLLGCMYKRRIDFFKKNLKLPPRPPWTFPSCDLLNIDIVDKTITRNEYVAGVVVQENCLYSVSHVLNKC